MLQNAYTDFKSKHSKAVIEKMTIANNIIEKLGIKYKFFKFKTLANLFQSPKSFTVH